MIRRTASAGRAAAVNAIRSATDSSFLPTSPKRIIVGIAGSRGELEPFYAFLIRGDEVIVVEHPEAPFGNGGVTALSAVAPNGLALGSWSSDVAGVIHGNMHWFL